MQSIDVALFPRTIFACQSGTTEYHLVQKASSVLGKAILPTSLYGQAGHVLKSGDVASMNSGSWGLLRNALQEFPTVTWLGVDNSHFNARSTSTHMSSDAFGIANTGSRWSTPRMLQNHFAATPNQGRPAKYPGLCIKTWQF